MYSVIAGYQTVYENYSQASAGPNTHFFKIWIFSIEIFRNSTCLCKNQQVYGLWRCTNFNPWYQIEDRFGEKMTFLGNLNVFVLYQGLSVSIKCSFIVDYWRRQVMVIGYLNCSYFVLYNLYTWYLYQSQKKLPVPTSKTPPKKRTSERSLYLICCDITRH